MPALLKIVDEHFGSGRPGRLEAVELHLASERVTAREIIARRVAAEVEAVNRTRRGHNAERTQTRSLIIRVEEDSAERRLNLPLIPRRKVSLIDAEEETERAQRAFARRQFIMLLDDKQIDGLDDEVTLGSASEMVFLYLVPLKGG